MNPTHLMTMTGRLRRRAQDGAPDAFGDPTVVETVDVVKCAIFGSSSSEQTDGETVTDQSMSLFLPPDADVEAVDGIVVDGTLYELDGPAWRAWNPRLRRYTHYQAKLRVTSTGRLS
ncbi:MAG: hypothetical protein AB7R77_12620 [Ilumatobacteraceae bacterium]